MLRTLSGGASVAVEGPQAALESSWLPLIPGVRAGHVPPFTREVSRDSFILVLPLDTKHQADAIANRLSVEAFVEPHFLAIQIQRRGVVEFIAADGLHPECVSVGAGVPIALLNQLKRDGIIGAFEAHVE